MYALIAFVPIILTIVLMVGFNWPAKRALPLAWLVAVIIGVALWKMPLLSFDGKSAVGQLWSSFSARS